MQSWYNCTLINLICHINKKIKKLEAGSTGFVESDNENTSLLLGTSCLLPYQVYIDMQVSKDSQVWPYLPLNTTGFVLVILSSTMLNQHCIFESLSCSADGSSMTHGPRPLSITRGPITQKNHMIKSIYNMEKSITRSKII